MKTCNLEQLLENNQFLEFLKKYLENDEQEIDTIKLKYSIFAKQLQAKRFVLPVTGVQGSGKSILLNAIAFDKPVLPVDVDETTCVPVEIVWSEEPDAKALVRYQNGREDVVEATENTLKHFVHNEFNPGNKLGVDRIVINSDCPALKYGMVLVDLPGTGSLTKANIETTEKYLDEAVGVFFLLRTTPPLTQSQSIFVTFQWARFPTAIFVQNRWADETITEVNDGRKHNIAVLENIAERNRIPLEGPPDIKVVNAYRALEGTLSNNQDLIDNSGLNDLVDNLIFTAKEWTKVLRESIVAYTETDIISVKNIVQSELNILKMDSSEAKEKLRSDQERFNKYIGQVRNKTKNTQDDADNLINELSKLIDTWASSSRAKLRNNMRSKMRSGIVDGPRLERALRDEESVVLDEIYEEVLERMLTFQDDLKEKFKDISEWELVKPDSYRIVSRQERIKIENIAPTIMGAGAGFAGALKGAAFGAAIGSVVPLVGSIVGGVIGTVIGGLFGSLLGRGVKKGVTRVRANNIEKDVFTAIRAFTADTVKNLKEQIAGISDNLSASIYSWEAAQIQKFEREKARMEEILQTSDDKREERIAQIIEDIRCAENYLEELDGVL